MRASLVVHELASGVGPLTGQRHAIEHRHHEGSHERDGLEGAGCFGSVNHDFDEVRHEGIQWGTGPRLRVLLRGEGGKLPPEGVGEGFTGEVASGATAQPHPVRAGQKVFDKRGSALIAVYAGRAGLTASFASKHGGLQWGRGPGEGFSR